VSATRMCAAAGVEPSAREKTINLFTAFRQRTETVDQMRRPMIPARPTCCVP
jgi:hypothetical protein